MIVLFVNHKIENCGVYQYGYRLYQILQKSKANQYIYGEVDCFTEYLQLVQQHNPTVILYNYHGSTMSWLNKRTIRPYGLNIGIPHESEHNMFHMILSLDPQITETANVVTIPRPIYEDVQAITQNHAIQDAEIANFIHYNEGEEVPIFGSFGFGFLNKGFDKIVRLINNQYEKAIIKLVVTFAHFDPNRDYNIHTVNHLCHAANQNPNIKLMITNKFFSNEEILLFLESNTANLFLYDPMPGRGISSVIDYAMSVNKPFMISDSCMFRHVYSDDICVYKTKMREAIEHSKNKLPEWLETHSHAAMIQKVDQVVMSRGTR